MSIHSAPKTSHPHHRVGIIGWPVEHSVSPAMHNAAFEALGLGWRYECWPTPPEQLAARIASLREPGIVGANVTVPHKEAVIPYLDEITEDARVMGAVNTIVVRDERLMGHNTDWRGFLTSLREAGFDPQGRRCAVIGAGGAARAVVYALAQAGAEVAIYNRTVERARHLVRDLGAHLSTAVLEAHGLDELATVGEETALLVNATSLGMWPQVEGCPWPETRPLPPHLVVCDLVYNPLETRLLARAREAGCTTVDGLGMLVWQGAEAFRLWTGEEPPVEQMREAALQAINSDQ